MSTDTGSSIFSSFSFEFSMDKAQRQEYLDLFWTWGVPCAAAALLVFVFVWRVLHFHINRVASWAVTNSFVKSADDTVDLRRARIVLVLLYAFLLSPLVLIFGWGFSTATKVEPWDLGAAMVTVWPAVLLTLLGGLIWRAKGWHMGPINRSNWFTALQTFFAVAGLMVIVWEVCTIFVGSWSYLSVSWVFLSINMILVIMAVFSAFAPPEGYTSVGLLARATAYIARRGSGAAAHPRVSAVGSTYQRNRRVAVYYALSIVTLLVYAILNNAKASNSDDDGKLLAFATACTVIVLDIGAAMLIASGLLDAPTLICGVLAVGRVLLIMFGAAFWLIGTSAAYFVFGIVLAWVGVRRMVASSLLKVKGSSNIKTYIVNLIVSPLGVLTLYSAAFGLLLVVVVTKLDKKDGDVPMRQVQLFSQNRHAQYIYGLAALLAVILWLGALLVWGQYRLAARQLTKRVLILAGLEEAAILACGLVLHFLTDSGVILAVTLFVPPAAWCLWLMYRKWVMDDFHIMPALFHSGHVAVAEKAAKDAGAAGGDAEAGAGAGAGAGGMGSRRDSRMSNDGELVDQGKGPERDMVHGLLSHVHVATRVEDWLMLGEAVVVLLCCIFFGMIVSNTTEPRWAGWAALLALLMMLASAAPIIQYFNTLKVTKFMIGSLALAFVLHVSLHVFALVQFSEAKNILGVLMSFVLYPSLVAAYVCLKKLKEDNWAVSKFVIITLGVSQLFVVAAIVFVYVIFESVAAVVACGVLYLVVVLAATVIGKWAANEFWLPRLWQLCLQGLVAVVVLAGVLATFYLYVIEDNGSAAIVVFSICYAVVFLAALFVAISKQHHSTGLHRYYSKRVLPVVEIDPHTAGIHTSNSAALLTFMALGLGYLYGVAAATFLVPAYLGLLVCATCKVSAVLYWMTLSRDSETLVVRACHILAHSDEPDHLDKVLLDAIATAKSQLDETRKQRVSAGVGSTRDRASTGGGGSSRGDRSRGQAESKIDVAGGGGPSSGAAPKGKSIRGGSELREEALRVDVLYRSRPLLSEMTDLETILPRLVLGCCSVPAEPAMASNPMHSGAGAGADAPRPQDAASRALRVAKRLQELDEQLIAASKEEIHFDMLIQHFISQAGQREQARALRTWLEFLRWCTAPERAGLLQTNNMEELTVLGNTSADRVPKSPHMLYKRWVAELGTNLADERLRQLEHVMDEHQAALNSAKMAAERRRREDEEAAARQARLLQERMEARRRDEAQRQREEEERRRRQEADLQRRREEETRRQAEEARRQQEEAERARRMQDEAERARLQAEIERRRQEEEARRREIERKLAAEEARRKAEAEAARQAQEAKLSGDIDFEAEDKRVLARVKELGARGPWTDREFIGSQALGDAGHGSVRQWVRASDFASQPKVKADGYSPGDIKQGSLGDCWFLSACAVMATRPELLDRVIITKEYNPQGVYAVRFFKGEWTTVYVDDLFPAKDNVYVRGEKGPFRGQPNPSSGKYAFPAFVASATRDELWMMILEKAYAKLFGSYSAIDGGLVHFALADFTGGEPDMLTVTDAEVRPAVDDGSLFQKLIKYEELGYLLGAGSPSGSDSDVSSSGVVQGHAYSVLQVRDVNGNQLMQLRNPWGSKEWNGKWGDTDTHSWTRYMKQKLNYDPETQDADDGTFWISFQDFCRNFEDIYVCKLYKTVEEGGKWHKYTYSGEWKRGQAGGCPNYKQCDLNPQFYIKPSRPCLMNIALAQKDQRGQSGDKIAIGMKLLNKRGGRCKRVYAGDAVLSSPYGFSTQVTMEGNIRPESYPYTLMVSTFKPDQYTTFRVTVYSQAPLEMVEGSKLQLIPDSVPAK